MAIYDYDVDSIRGNNTPLRYRYKPKFTAWMLSLLYPLQWLRDNTFNDYIQGSAAPLWNPLATYNTGDRIKGYGNAVFESIVDGNIGIDPDQALNASDFWMRISDDYRGVNERLKYNSQKLMLEYVLNKFFRTTFIQPDDVNTPTNSNIYIQNLTPNNLGFIIGNSVDVGSSFVNSPQFSTNFILNSYDSNGDSFAIFVPETITSPIPGFFTSLQPYAEEKIRAIADKYVLAGIQYRITTY